jgi:hypothetical protein
MRPESLGATIERAFGELTPPPIEQLAADVRSVADYVVEAVRLKTWEELRPLQRYFPEAWVLQILSARTFQYYLPAFLFALIDGEEGDRYLGPVLESLGYTYSQEGFERAQSWFRSPAGMARIDPGDAAGASVLNRRRKKQGGTTSDRHRAQDGRAG